MHNELGKKIADYRKAKGLSRGQLAEKCHVSKSTVFHWENGDTSKISYGSRKLLSSILGIPMMDFIMSDKDRINIKEDKLMDSRYTIMKMIAQIDDERRLNEILVIVKALKAMKGDNK